MRISAQEENARLYLADIKPTDIRVRMMSFAAWVKGLRTLLRLNQAPFAELVGVSQGTVSRWEKGGGWEPGHQDKLDDIAADNDYPLYRGDRGIIVNDSEIAELYQRMVALDATGQQLAKDAFRVAINRLTPSPTIRPPKSRTPARKPRR